MFKDENIMVSRHGNSKCIYQSKISTNNFLNIKRNISQMLPNFLRLLFLLSKNASFLPHFKSWFSISKRVNNKVVIKKVFTSRYFQL